LILLLANRGSVDETKTSRGAKRMIVASLLAFATLGAGFGWRGYLNREPVVNIPPYPKLPSPNGYDLYVQAAHSIVPANPAVDEIDDRNVPTDAIVRAQRYSLARKQEWLKQNRDVLALMQTALSTPCLHPSSHDPDAPYVPPLPVLRELARLKVIESKAHEMDGDWNRAVGSRIDVVQMGNEVSRGAVLITALLGIAIEAIGRSGHEELTKRLNAADCRAAIGRLEKIYNERVRLDAVLTEEKYRGQIELSEIDA
jgi:hypothetical protein